MQPPTVREAIRRLEADGWTIRRVRGDHRIFARGGKIISVPGSMGDVLKRGTWAAIRRQAGW